MQIRGNCFIKTSPNSTEKKKQESSGLKKKKNLKVKRGRTDLQGSDFLRKKVIIIGGMVRVEVFQWHPSFAPPPTPSSSAVLLLLLLRTLPHSSSLSRKLPEQIQIISEGAWKLTPIFHTLFYFLYLIFVYILFKRRVKSKVWNKVGVVALNELCLKTGK